MKILLVRLRLIGDVVFTTPLIRALRRQFPDAHLSYAGRAGRSPGRSGQPASRRGHRRCPGRAGWRGCARTWRLARQLRRAALRHRDRPARRSAERVAHLGQPRAHAHRLRDRGTAAGCTPPWWPRAADLAPRHSVANQWDLLAPLGIEPGATRPTIRWRCPEDPAAAAAIAARLRAAGVTDAHALVVIHVSAGNPFRRWPAPAFEDLVVAPGAARRPAARDPDLGPVRRRRSAPDCGRGARAARRPGHAVPRLRGVRSRRTPGAGGAGLGVHWGRQRAAARGRGHDRRRSWRCWARRCPSGRGRGATRAGLPRWWSWTLPCRPCHQRVCEPGDFRCLTWITPERVLEADRARPGGRDAASPENLTTNNKPNDSSFPAPQSEAKGYCSSEAEPSVFSGVV